MNNEKDLTKLVEQIKKSDNILVALSSKPSLDELASALGLTLMLNKNDRRAVAVFSGEVPKALSFLKLEKTFDQTADGLRDFIITLDSKKADRVVCKAEDGMVKVYITPAGTVVSEADLSFEQGDYNIDLVLALGVTSKETLDQALSAHGRILHNAVVSSITIGQLSSSLGNLNVQARQATSYAEIVAALANSLDKNLPNDAEPAMDTAVATALLTGLIAATNRFANRQTTAEIMTLAADLIKAGANQQMIASELAKVTKLEDEPTDAEISQEKGDDSLRPNQPKHDNVINLNTAKDNDKRLGLKPKPKTGLKPKKDEKPSPERVNTVKIAPNFANLEEYNAEQLEIDRARTADELAKRLGASKKEDSEDDKLEQALNKVKQDLETVSTGGNKVAPKEEIVFGKEVVDDRVYLQDDGKKPGDVNNQIAAEVDVPITGEDGLMRSGQKTLELLDGQSPEAMMVAPNAVDLLPEAETAPTPLEPATGDVVTADKQVSDEGVPIDKQMNPNTEPVPNAIPVMPDFSKLGIVPPMPPVVPGFANMMPPMPPNFPSFAAPAMPVNMPSQNDVNAQPVAMSDQTFMNSQASAPVAPVLDNTNAMPVQAQFAPNEVASAQDLSQVLPSVEPMPNSQPSVVANPVMQDQVYPQPIDNAQFVIPE